MKAALFALAAGSLVGSAFSLNARHAALHEKKDVLPRGLDYGCCQNVVTVTVWADEPAPTTTTSVQVVNVNVNPTPAAAPPASAPPPAAAAPAPAASSAAAPPPSSGSGGIITNGNKWAMSYTPYTTTGACKAAADVLTDVTTIKSKGFTTLRLYGVDCDGLNTVGAAARAVGMKLIVGIFIKAGGVAAAQPDLAAIVAWGNSGNWDMVVMLVVGNEAMSQGFCSAQDLAGFISSAKGALTAAGQGSIPVTTTETVGVLGANIGPLCPVVDVIAANIQSYFDGGVVAANAGDFVSSQLAQVQALCPGKPYYNLESGWPSAGGNNGASIASPDAQAAAISDIVAKVGGKTVVFSYSNDQWKPAGIEQNFGCVNLF